MASLTPFDLWRRATPLSKARIIFAGKDLQDQLASLPPEGGMEQIKLMLQAQFSRDQAEKDAANAELAKLSALSAERRRVLAAMEQQVFARYRRGELALFGFEAPRRATAMPLRIGASFLSYLPHWEAGSYTQEGLNLIELRLIEVPMELPNSLDASVVDAKSNANRKQEATRAATAVKMPRPAGRPSYRAEILQAFEALTADGSFVQKPLTKGIVQVRAWIKTNLPETKAARATLSDDAIRNAVKPRLSAIHAKLVEKL